MAETETGKRFAIHAPTGNPKDRLGALKPPLHLNPPVASLHQAAGQLIGAEKYGPFNWREEKVAVTVYLSALKRHIDAYEDGEDYDEYGVHHLGYVMAGAAVVLDAEAYGSLIDDRPPKNSGYKKVRAWFDNWLKGRAV